jgi:hypothetical protein
VCIDVAAVAIASEGRVSLKDIDSGNELCIEVGTSMFVVSIFDAVAAVKTKKSRLISG